MITQPLDLAEIEMFIPANTLREVFPEWSDAECNAYLWNLTPWPIAWDRDTMKIGALKFKRYLLRRAIFGIKRWPDPDWYFTPRWVIKRKMLAPLLRWHIISERTWMRAIWGDSSGFTRFELWRLRRIFRKLNLCLPQKYRREMQIRAKQILRDASRR